MSKNLHEIPFTEICERVLEITRTPNNSMSKIRGDVNEVYTVEIPVKFDWNFLIASTSIVTTPEYTTGTVSATTGSSTVTFSSDATITADMTGRKIKFSGNDVVYEFTYSNATGGTINPAFYGSSNASSTSYSIFQNIYALPTEFDRFPKNGGVYKWNGGQKTIISEESYQEATSLFQSSPTDNPDKVRLVSTDTLGRQLIEFRPAPKSQKVYGCDYMRKLKPLRETSSGTVSISASQFNFVGSSDARFLEANTGDYIRVDPFGVSQDSTWYRISLIIDNSSLFVNTPFASSSVTNAEYVISSVPEYPAKLHPALIYGASRMVTVDQNDENALYHVARYAEVLSDGKRIYVSRVYNQKIETIAEEFRYRY